MKAILLFLCFSVVLFFCNAQTSKPQLSANLQQYLLQAKSEAKRSSMLSKADGAEYLSTIIKVNGNVNETKLSQIGALVGTKAGDIWTVQVPYSQIQTFIQLSDINYIQLDEPIVANLDAARKSARVDSVHAGIALPKAYSGKGVVVGIIDAGFDYTHPTFYDTTGNVLRIKRVWEQRNAGTPPQGYSYGNEIKDSTNMLAKGYEVNSFSHGTHVGGIAAGSGFGSSKNRGVAYESELVFVGIKPEKSEWKGMGMASIIDGVNYIFNYAQSVGKPAVVNLSWGCSIGPNDGSSLFSQALNNLTGSGKIFVLSAGNNGEENIHVQKVFSTTDTLVRTFVDFPNVGGELRNWVDIWGDTSKSFCIDLSLYNGSVMSKKLPTMCLSNLNKDTFILGTANDTCFISITSIIADYNGRPHILLDLFNKTGNKLCIGISANDGKINMWQGYVKDYTGYDGAFITNGQTWAVAGDNKYTLGEMSCTKSAITVAAYASKTSFKNLQNSTLSYSNYVPVNQIVPFSSHGPTADGRIKPDIAAPGLTIASSVNSYDISYATGGNNYSQSVLKYTSPKNNRDYYYAEASGTSMSSPMVSGIVALMLQVNPTLTPQQIKTMIFESAWKDTYTSFTPDSTRWGAGKINAYGAIKKAILTLGLESVSKLNIQHIQVYPNPNNGIFNIELQSDKAAIMHIEVTNMLGQTVSIEPWTLTAGKNIQSINLSHMPQGMYFVNAGGNQFKVMISE